MTTSLTLPFPDIGFFLVLSFSSTKHLLSVAHTTQHQPTLSLGYSSEHPIHAKRALTSSPFRFPLKPS